MGGNSQEESIVRLLYKLHPGFHVAAQSVGKKILLLRGNVDKESSPA